MRNSKLHSNVLLAGVYLYITVPFLLFALGWLHAWLSVPLCALVAVGLCRMVKLSKPLWTPDFDKKTLVKLAAALVIITVWVFFSGIGKFSWQTEDHAVRNVLYIMLVEQPWPIVDMNPPPEYFAGPVAFSYYFGYWLPAALVGKLLGLFWGDVFQVVWAIAGIGLLYWLLLAGTVKKVVLWPLWVFIFFSGLDWVATMVMKGHWINVVTATPHLEQWANIFQYSSHTTQLYWVFNQAIPAWVLTALFFAQRDNRGMGLLWGANLLNSTLPMVGLLPLAAYFALRNQKENEGQLRAPGLAKSVLTFENVTGVLVALVLTLFITTNNQTGGLNILLYMFGELWALYLLFIALEVGVFFALVWRYQHKNPLFYLAGGLLLVFPWIQLGPGIDFCMRASIPPLVILCIFVVQALAQSREKRHWVTLGLLCLVLVVGAMTAQTEFMRSFALTTRAWASGQPLDFTYWHPMEVIWRDNFYANMEDHFFYKYLLRASL